MNDNQRLGLAIWLMLVVIWLVLGATLVLPKQAIVVRPATISKQDVYSICISGHFEDLDHGLEQACGNAQDQTNTEFMCSQDGSVCWLESK